uniref:Glucan endo-1,3-beta-glucosidase, basic isoform n=1 Tax=Anthurium amnicola TaxID=1678845 RepID=A0A1D1ZJX0_9ARAE
MACNGQLPMAVALVLLLGLIASAQSIGVCYGTLGNNLPSPAEVIGMFKSHKVPKMRIYAPSEPILSALRGSNIDLLLDAPGPLDVLARDKAAAHEWVRTNVLAYWPDVRFRYIAVGNEEILKPGVAEYIYPAMLNIYDALASAGLQGQIKVSTSFQYNVLGESFPPSKGEFSQQVLPLMRPIVSFLARTGAPLLVNIYPYFSYAGNTKEIALDYALFTSPETVVKDPKGLEYQNLFDAMVDAVHFAMDKVGGAGVDVVVSETGWPTDAGVAATVDNARTYNTNLVRHVGKGTPKKPGKAVETYIFAMFNENQKKPPGIENHWGLFYPNKQPVYPISF